MGSKRQLQVSEILAQSAAEFFARESNRQSLITVTRANISPDLKNVTIFLSVIPATAEAQAIDFAKRNRTDFREFLKDNARLKFLPHIEFELDYGEKNRQRIDDLTRN